MSATELFKNVFLTNKLWYTCDKRMALLEIFPEVVYQDNLPIKTFSLDNVEFDESGFSKNCNVLNLDSFKDIKTLIENSITKYTHELLSVSNDVTFYITRSWIINMKRLHFNSEYHNHANSFFTGVVYLELDEEKDSIQFKKTNEYKILEFDYDVPNKYNQSELNFFPMKNDIIIFDAKTYHRIGAHITTTPRICLAFEVFAKGTFGKKNMSNDFNVGQLTLK